METITGSVYTFYILVFVLVVVCALALALLWRGRSVGREGQDLYRAVVEQVADGIIIFDFGTSSVLEVNPALAAMLGYEPPEVRGRSIYDLIAHDRADIEERVGSLARGEGRFMGEMKYRNKDGSLVDFEVVASRISYEGREAICAVLRDVGERRETERRVREAEERYRALVEQVPAVVYVQDIETGQRVYESPQIESILGYAGDLHETDPTYWRDIIHPEDRERVLKTGEESAEAGSFSMEYRVRSERGRTVWLLDDARAVPDDEGRPRLWQGILFDITDRKDAEDALRESEERYRGLVQLSPDAVIVHHDGRIAYINEAAARLLGFTSEGDAVGKALLDFVHPDDRRTSRGRIRRVMRGETVEPMEQRWLRNGGETVHVEATAAPVRYRGKPAAQVILRDVTGRKEAEREAARQRAELIRSNAELEQFAYLIAHDLRAPLRSLDGFSQVLLEDRGDSLVEEDRDNLGRIRTAAQKMSRMIDELLDLSRLTRTSMEREDVDLSDLARQAASELQHRDPDRRVETIIAGGLATKGDRGLLEVAVTNLMENAWKFTSRSPRARVVFGRIEEGGEPVYFVRDNGVGFDMAYAGKLFSPFQRLHSEEDFDGTGIGLAAVARVIERHGGRVWAEGESGRGATFYFTL